MNTKFLILGYFGFHNAGDDAIGYSILKYLSQNNPSADITVSAKNSYFEKISYPFFEMDGGIRTCGFSLFSVLSEIKKVDCVLYGGGTHFHDDDQYYFNQLKTYLFFLLVSYFCSLAKKKLIFLGHGLGPINKPLSKFFLKLIFRKTKSISVRDHDSYEIVESLGFKEKCFLGFDCTGLLLEDIKKLNSDANKQKKKKIIGISCLPAYSEYMKNPSKDKEMIKDIVESIKPILKNRKMMEIKFFSFNNGQKSSDKNLIINLKDQLKEFSDKLEIVEYNSNITSLLSEISNCDAFLGMKYHSILFAYLFNKPLIVVGYLGKCNSLAKSIKLPDHAFLSLEEVHSTKFCKTIQDFLNDSSKYRSVLPQKEALKLTKDMFRQVAEV